MVKFHLQGVLTQQHPKNASSIVTAKFNFTFIICNFSPLREPPQRQPPARSSPHRPVPLADGGRVARLALPAGFGAVALPHCHRRAERRRESSDVVAAAVVVLDDVLEGPRRVRLPHVVRLALLGPIQDGLQVKIQDLIPSVTKL